MRDESEILAVLTGERLMAGDAGGRERPSRREIALLAYSFYELRGRRHGHDVDDWLAAEVQLKHHYE